MSHLVAPPPSGRAVLEDSATVLTARAELDALVLEVLTAPGLGELEVDRLRRFVTGAHWVAATAALVRLRAVAGGAPW